MRGEIDTPCQSRRTAKNLKYLSTQSSTRYLTTYLDSARLEHTLHHISVRPKHPSMVYPEAVIEQLLHLLVSRHAYVTFEQRKRGMLLATELIQKSIYHRSLLERERSLDCLLARMDEHHHLVSGAHHLGDFLECHAVQVSAGLRTVGLAAYANEMLFQWYGTEGRVEVEKARVAVDTEEVGDINVIGKRGAQPDNTNNRLCRFDLERL